MSCVAPIPFETLVSLWCGELADEHLEEHLFACDECAAASERLGRLVVSLRGLIAPVLSHERRDLLRARGLNILELAFESGQSGEAVFARELDLLVFALRGDLAAAERVDIEVATVSGQVILQFPYVPFDAARGEVLVACQQHFRMYDAMYGGDPEFRVFAYEGGARRQVGSYVIKHVWPPL